MRTRLFAYVMGAVALVAVPIAAVPIAAARELVGAPAQAQAQVQAQAGIQPTAQSDFSCFVLIVERRRLMESAPMAPDARNRILYNLDLIASFYRGRLSQLPVQNALALFQRGRAAVASLSPEQQDAEAQNCAALYEAVNKVTARLAQGIDPTAG